MSSEADADQRIMPPLKVEESRSKFLETSRDTKMRVCLAAVRRQINPHYSLCVMNLYLWTTMTTMDSHRILSALDG